MKLKEIRILPGLEMVRHLVKNVKEGESYCDALFSWKRIENKFDNCIEWRFGISCLIVFIKFHLVTKENRIKL